MNTLHIVYTECAVKQVYACCNGNSGRAAVTLTSVFTGSHGNWMVLEF